MRTSPIARRPSGETTDRLAGYRAITIDGIRVGTVASVTDDTIAIRRGRWPFASTRLFSAELAVIRDIDRTMIVLTALD